MNDNVAQLKEPGPLFRWTVLIFISLAMFGNYYIYDSISPLADILKSQLNFKDQDIGLLQGIYSIPNVIMVLIGGLLIDRIGTKKSAFIFSLLCMIGALFTVIKGELVWMATGRLIFGLGAESLIVAITTVIARWFKGKELSLAFGINLTIARLGTFAALNSPSWAKSYYHNWDSPLWIATIFGVLSVISVVIYFFLDRYAEGKYALQKEGEQDQIDLKQVFTFTKQRLIFAIILILIAILAIPSELDTFKWTAVLASILFFIRFKQFGSSYLYIILICVTFYSGIFPFMTFSTKFFIEEHFVGIPQDIARGMGGFLTSLLILATMILTPLFGLLADKIGKRATMMIVGSFMLIPVYLLMNYIKVEPLIPEETFSKMYTNEEKFLDFCNTQNEILDSLKQNSEPFYLNNQIVKINDECQRLLNDLNLKDKYNFIIKDSKIQVTTLYSPNFFESLAKQVSYFFNMVIILFLYFPNLVIPMIIMGIAFSLIPAVMWPSVALIVDSSKLGTAYGLMTMIQNVGLAGFNFIIGGVNDATSGYSAGMWIFSTLGFFGVFFAYMLKRKEMGENSHGLENKSLN